MKYLNCLFLILILFVFASCDDNAIFEENKEMSGGIWKAGQPVHFEVDIKDTVTLHNFYVNLRNGENYPYSNLYFFVEMEFPNAKKSIDTVNCYLADPTGKWLGTGLGDIYDHRFLYLENKQFPLAGRYKIDIYQAMRTNELVGVRDVGFRLSKANK